MSKFDACVVCGRDGMDDEEAPGISSLGFCFRHTPGAFPGDFGIEVGEQYDESDALAYWLSYNLGGNFPLYEATELSEILRGIAERHDCEKWIDEGVCCKVCKPFAQKAASASWDRAWGVVTVDFYFHAFNLTWLLVTFAWAVFLAITEPVAGLMFMALPAWFAVRVYRWIREDWDNIKRDLFGESDA